MKAAKIAIRRLLENRVAGSWFLERAQDRTGRVVRSSLLRSFGRIGRTVKCEHFPREMLVMVDYILSAAPEGPLVECGCFLGGSSAQN
jgi:hypothetical protein